ncbi:MAG: hypothetical protein HF308_14340 [Ignavibacteria bacterium]|jgi:hypothetical protein|nr:hypothetical protein [Ignavibacteria bacterium]
MAVLKWDEVGKRLYETGVSKGVLFTQKPDGTYNPGVPWSGLVSVKKSPDGGEETPFYADNMKYLSLFSAENLKGSIDAFTYPVEFEACDGSQTAAAGIYVPQQNRVPFALAWSTVVGNDTVGNTYGEKIHIIYNAKVSPAERAYETINDSPQAITFSWNFTTTPINLSDIGLAPAAGLVFDKSLVSVNGWKALTDKLYGNATTGVSGIGTPQEMINLAKVA